MVSKRNGINQKGEYYAVRISNLKTEKVLIPNAHE